MLTKILIANRGEIALRIMRTAKRLGLGTVAVYADADADAMHVAMADEAVHIGASPAVESYLRIDKIVDAAQRTGADAVHPGYGFLAENAEFADACVAAGLRFVGPSGAAMRKLGGKADAKAIARAAGVPVVPGYEGAQDDDALREGAAAIGYPVMIKAVSGGGGRGMRLVESADAFDAALESARREAAASFGDATVLVEKVVQRPRHIEVQVFGDEHGNVVHLFERDCTLQRRNQKVIEEAPAPGMTAPLREAMTQAAVALAQSVGYVGAGTVEFLVEGGTLDAQSPWYFIEMNTRLQVEHPVTEMVTGLDLVAWQLDVAAGRPLPLEQSAITCSGHAIEARLCAEDPTQGFQPSIGRIEVFEVAGADPDGRADPAMRLETGVARGDEISPFYDSMIAKLIVHAPARPQAVDRLADALAQTCIAGPRTNVRFLRNLMVDDAVREARDAFDTGLIARRLEMLGVSSLTPAAATAGLQAYADWRAGRVEATGESPIVHGVARVATGPVASGSHNPWHVADGFRLGAGAGISDGQAMALSADGTPITPQISWSAGTLHLHDASGLNIDHDPGVAAANAPPHHVRTTADGVYLFDRGWAVALTPLHFDVDSVEDDASGDVVRAPITGKLVAVDVKPGQLVTRGEKLAVVEAMKMEHVLGAPRDGTVAQIGFEAGVQVSQGSVIVALEPVSDD
ncbi:MAG: biotin carboxylase N-terminal domain-containing protein [Pseudomonadota bacterium]